MRRRAVENDMDGFSGRDFGFEYIQKADKFLMAMAVHAAADHFAFKHVERGEESGRAVALVIMGHCSGPTLLHGQSGLGAVKRLDLALLVEGQDDGMSRWVGVEANHVAQLVDKPRIVGEF